ncbi:MAG: hypothetical protein ACLTB0_02785 [Finegoldia magna]|nr:hypothetical protein [Finegoldia magna]MDU1009733.1 hypothetical protein [Finegoldia magna]MDU1086916.1 hypothetical protein [Finegoldia magna]
MELTIIQVIKKMNLAKFDRKNIKLQDKEDSVFVSKAYYCDKEDYETDEDGLEMIIDGRITIFYESDIKSIEIFD